VAKNFTFGLLLHHYCIVKFSVLSCLATLNFTNRIDWLIKDYYLQVILSYKQLMFLSKHHSFGSSGFKCSGPSIAVEKMIWGAMKEVCRPLV